jgi:hypothetical protein
MNAFMPQFLPATATLLTILLGVAGCQSRSPSHYVSPRVMGRVVDRQTGLPLKGVEVRRVVPDYNAGTMEQQRGGESLQQLQGLHTAADGTFDLGSQKSVALFRDIGWFSVELSFKHSGYATFVTNYTRSKAVASASGEPVIQAGDISLSPRSK